MNKKILKISFLFAIMIFAFNALDAEAAVCNFTRDLEEGAKGEDVRCLQQYLNSSGNLIATSGVGSSGHETDTFRALTKKAVIGWQSKNGIIPAEGFFGAKSQIKYKELTAVPALPTLGGTSNNASSTLIAELNNQLATLRGQLVIALNAPKNVTAEEKKAIDRIREAVNMVGDADDQIDDSGGDTTASRANLNDAEEDLLEAIRLFFNKKNFLEAFEAADDAFNNAEEAFEDSGGETPEDEADDTIDAVDDKIKAAEDKIDLADDVGEDVEQAEKLLNKANDKLEMAKDELDNKNYEEAEDLADEAEDLVDDAIDAIGDNDDKDNAEEAIDDARDAIDEAEDKINEADDDGDDVNDAEDILDDAKNKLDDAEEEFDDENYDNAKDLADEAQDLADGAVDAID